MTNEHKQNPDLTLDELYQQGKEALPDYFETVEKAFDALAEKYPDAFEGAYLETDLNPDWGEDQDNQLMGALQVLFKSDKKSCYSVILKFLTENNIEFQKIFWADSYE